MKFLFLRTIVSGKFPSFPQFSLPYLIPSVKDLNYVVFQHKLLYPDVAVEDALEGKEKGKAFMIYSMVSGRDPPGSLL